MRLQDKVLLVTGSTTGIGEAMARLFAREGARVVVHGPEEPPAAGIAASIRAEGGRASHVAADLREAGAAALLIAGVVRAWGRIDGLVNNAAVITRSNLDTTDADTFDRTVAVNLRAPLLLIRAALPHFRGQGGGRVLNIGSINAHCGERDLLDYSISKGGLVTLTRNLADAHGAEGLRVNLLNVGWTLTPNEYALQVRAGMAPDWPQKLPAVLAPSGRLLAPEDIARAAAFFLSDESPLLNGAVLDFEQFPVVGRNPLKTP